MCAPAPGLCRLNPSRLAPISTLARRLQECFQNANHDGHDVSFYISRAVDGGCCDCGDESAWDRAGFCKKHGKTHTNGDMIASLPVPLRATGMVFFSAIFEELLSFVRIVATTTAGGMDAMTLRRIAAIGESHKAGVLLKALQWLNDKCCAFDGLSVLASQVLCQEPGRGMAQVEVELLPVALQQLRECYNQRATAARPPVRDTASAGTLVDAPMPVAQHTSTSHSDLEFPATADSILEQLLLLDLSLRSVKSDLARALHGLYLRLLSEATFKRAFAVCYTTNYSRLARLHFEASFPGEEESLFSSQVCVRWRDCIVCVSIGKALHAAAPRLTTPHQIAPELAPRRYRYNSSTGLG